jgi:hypothetical protein
VGVRGRVRDGALSVRVVLMTASPLERRATRG